MGRAPGKYELSYMINAGDESIISNQVKFLRWQLTTTKPLNLIVLKIHDLKEGEHLR